ncbi:O-antigen ligase family protein [Mucilaginibacter gilvus]|uniref:O-antigen ligase domain-containing protein n=1 Tax=Mucilaginibacter gilvus TaxID=2305909 RepID=A0A3S3V8R7_9SPHI|nr:O-antigen ligase family protein [Mucilaginibacter gilvus]RWY48109.1 hypothetical protein EPL05_21250 [Mucilaginibacter gilvus]
MIFRIIGFTLIYLQIERVTDNQVVRFLTIAFILGIAVNDYRKTKHLFPYSAVDKTLVVFVLITVVSLLRTASPVSTTINVIYSVAVYLTYSFFILTSYVYLVSSRSLDWKKVVAYTMFYPLAIFVSLNLLLWSLGIKISSFVVIENTTEAVMLSKFGIHIQRVIFPLSGGGLNTYGDIVGALLLVVLVMTIQKLKLINILVIFIALASILLVDDRSFLFNAIVGSFIMYYISKTRLFKYSKIMPVYLIAAPFLLLYLLPIIYTSVSSSLLRTDEKESLARVLVWTKSTEVLSDFRWMDVIGYGEYGHYSSGASKLWAYFFKDWARPNYISPHNTFFSTVYDIGYIGVIVTFMLIRKSIIYAIRLWKMGGEMFLPLLIVGFWCYYLLSSATETLNGFYSPGMIYLFQSVLIISGFSKYERTFTIQTETVYQ